jgi:tetratricopeptide (TPR) repeat protein
MQAEHLSKILRDPHNIMPEDVAALHDLLRMYPYFQAAHALLAKAAYAQDQPRASQAVQRAAVYATDRNYLKALLENTPPFAVPAPDAMSVAPVPHFKEAKVGPEAREHGYVNSYINAIQQKAQRKATNHKSLAQLDSIQAFLQKNVDFRAKSLQRIPSEVLQVDLAQKSTVLHDDLATENLARVLQQQGKMKQALAIYEKLVLKFPEKRTYFTSLIKKIKHQS